MRALSLFAALAFSHAAGASTLANGRITVVFAQPPNTTDHDRVDSISWIDSSGASTGNLAANGGDRCGDVAEFFGDSYGTNEPSALIAVFAGSVSKAVVSKAGLYMATTTNGQTCFTDNIVATSKYVLVKTAGRVNAMKIQRTFSFDAGQTIAEEDLRAYVPRLPIGQFPNVLVPDASGKVQTLQTCDTACEVTSWNGIWFAEQDSTGHGMAVFRDKSSTMPAAVALDHDSTSGSNNTSIALKVPAAGWSGSVTETEWLCFYDATTWPAARQAKGKLPSGCVIPVP